MARTLKQLSQELVRLANEDQRALKTTPFPQDIRKLIREHTRRMKQIVNRIGWPSASKVGERAAWAAWILTQHSDEDPQFQIRCLKLIKKTPNAGRAEDIAYLEDRVRVNTGRKQIYGSQYKMYADGRYAPWPLADPKNVNKRRLAVGLEPLEQYDKVMQEKAKPSFRKLP